MPAPTKYVRDTSFAGFQANNPHRPLPGAALDNELENVEQALGQTVDALADIRRPDGQLRNGIVGRDALASELATGVRPATLWQTGLQYQAQDTVSFGAAFYRCKIGHISSSSFLTDLTANRWEIYADIGPVATDAQNARNEAVAARDEAVPAAAVATAASANTSTLYDLFDDRYLGEKTSLPTLDNDGNALVNGALVSLTGQTPATLNGLYVRRSGAWFAALSPAQGVFLGFRYVATGGQTVFSGVDASGQTLAYTIGTIMVTVNGVVQTPNTFTADNGASVVLGAALTAGDIVVVYSFGSFVSSDTWSKAEADARFAATAHTQAASTISDSTAAGRAVLTAVDAAAQRTALGLGTAATAATGDFATASHTQAASTISDSTAAGRAVLTAVDAAAQRTALGLGTMATQATGSFVATSRAVATATGLTGGGDLTADRTIALNLPALTTENSIDTANDVVVFHDASANAHRKTSIASLVSSATAGVSTFNGRSGAVTPQAGDYTAAQVSALALAGGTLSGSVTVQAFTRAEANTASGVNGAAFVARAVGTATGQRAGISFSPTFGSGGDIAPRRAADIWSGFDGGTWGTQYLAIGVGSGGSTANDAGNVTLERVRLRQDGISVGTTAQSPAGFLTSADGVSARGANPILQMHNTAAGADQKYWRWSTVDAGRIDLELLNDAYSAVMARPLSVLPSGFVGFSTPLPTATADVNGTARFRDAITFDAAATWTGPQSNEVARPLTERLTGASFEASRWGVDPSETAATNTTRLNNCISAVAGLGGGRILLPRGVINLNALATITANSIVLVGQGCFTGGTELRFNNATGDCITFSTSGHQGLENVYLTAGVRRTSGYAVVIASGFSPSLISVRIDYHFNGILVTGGAEIEVRDCLMRYMLGSRGVNFVGTTGSRVFRAYIENLRCDNPYHTNGDGVRRTWASGMTVNVGDIIVSSGRIYNASVGGVAGSTAPNGIPGTGASDWLTAEFVDGAARWRYVCDADLTWFTQDSFVYSMAIKGCVLLNGNRGFAMVDGANTGSSYPMWCEAYNMEIDHAYTQGVLLNAGEHFNCSGWIGATLAGPGVVMASTHRGEIWLRDTRIMGNWQTGIDIQNGPRNINILGCMIGANSQQSAGTFNGISIAAGASRFIISGCQIGQLAAGGNTQGWGVVVASGGSTKYVVTGNVLSDNISGGISDGGSGTKAVANNV